ncbi:recombinase family protein [Saccharothrix sp. BKS2]|uniref:recombinase family protein n=1 Tax=Saccharothrix sp. BKS2 TaxID=3064400 RepID=UPI0039EABE88
MTAPRKTRPTATVDTSKVLAYLRVSTAEQADSGAGLDAQRAAITAEALRHGWDVEFVVDAGYSAKSLDRPALTEALARLDRGEAAALVAAKLDRVSRSVADFASLLDRSRRKGWRLVLLDTGVDTSTASGELVSNMLASAAQYERRLISQRTRDGLAAKRAAGVRLGRPSVLPTAVVERIVGERAEGKGLRVIAEGLTADGVPTARGKATWSTSSVQAVLLGQEAEKVDGKYNPLNRYLRDAADRETAEIELAFAEIAALVGPLPASAYRRRSWWGNDSGSTHTQARAWRDAGWSVARVDLVGERVTFTASRASR